MCDLDGVFHALSNTKRRCVLDCLQRHNAVALPDLAEFVAERERGDDVAAISAETVRDVYFSLYHNHIPTLEEAGLADYQQERDRVASTSKTQSALVRARCQLDSLLRDT